MAERRGQLILLENPTPAYKILAPLSERAVAQGFQINLVSFPEYIDEKESTVRNPIDSMGIRDVRERANTNEAYLLTRGEERIFVEVWRQPREIMAGGIAEIIRATQVPSDIPNEELYRLYTELASNVELHGEILPTTPWLQFNYHTEVDRSSQPWYWPEHTKPYETVLHLGQETNPDSAVFNLIPPEYLSTI